MSEPNDFNSQFKQLCEAFERTTQGEWVAGSDFVEAMEAEAGSRVICQTFSKREEDFANAENHRQWVALAHNLFPVIKDEMERLTALLEGQMSETERWRSISDKRKQVLIETRQVVYEAGFSSVLNESCVRSSVAQYVKAALESQAAEVERLKGLLAAQSEAVHFHECTVGTFYDCPNPACTKARELLETKK